MTQLTPLNPSDLTVFVTGASSGFGYATATRFATAGAKVIATARRLDRLQKLVSEFGDARVHALALDVRNLPDVEAAVQNLPPNFAKPDILVNNAGLALGLEPVEKTKLENWQTMINTNINGLLYCTRTILPGMIQRNRGHIVNLSSIAASYPYPGSNVYGGTKAFVRQFSLGLRSDLAGRNIRVTSLEPGKAETEFSLVRFAGDAEKAANIYQGYQPLNGNDVAECIFWLTTLPRHINVNAMEVMPLSQSFADFPIKAVKE
ncbi:MAG: SDR family oxidoreductase [Alphaproteobacteria bacterium]